MLRGIDISNHNHNYIRKNNIDIRNDFDFCLMKASEGISYKDPYLDEYYNALHGSDDGRPDPVALYGFYHYARPELNDPKAEAWHFLDLVGHHAGYCIYALDVEGKALELPEKDLNYWVAKWIVEIVVQSGVLPLIYASESQLHRFPAAASLGSGLWVAKWGDGKKYPKPAPWPLWSFWQYKSDNLDYNYFNGWPGTFKKYCEVIK
jgi:GH25 family lysozyme M1 (1,4-beta-N-acetylmuramidase)